MTIRKEIAEVSKEPCRCTLCGLCDGTGNIRVPDRSMPEGWELEPCDQCNGGVIDLCDRCEALEALYEQLDECCPKCGHPVDTHDWSPFGNYGFCGATSDCPCRGQT